MVIIVFCAHITLPGWIRNQRYNRYNPYHSTDKISYNSKMSFRDLCWFSVTQTSVKIHKLKMMWKPCNDNINNKPEWLTKEKKSIIPSNNRSITCFPDVNDINRINKRRNLLAWKPWALTRRTERTTGRNSRSKLPTIYKPILSKRNKNKENVDISWIDFYNARDMIPQIWIIECLKMFYISD